APPEPLRDGVAKFGGLLLQATQQLAAALATLTEGDRETALELCTSVERAEEEAGPLNGALFRGLSAMDLPAGTRVLLRDLIESMEDTADKAEDAADRLRVLAVSRFS